VVSLRKSAAQWVAENPVLPATQIGQETDTLKVKRGNDVDPWNARPYDTTIVVSADGLVVATPRMRSAAQTVITGLVATPPAPVPAPEPGLSPSATLYPSTTLYPKE
jgi:hypothetical protein